MNGLKAPVAMIGFNRADRARRVFAAVREARPEKLFLIADGPRVDHAGEAERCAEVRRIMTAVDWPCAVETNFAAENMGCRARIVSGLGWVFEQVEEAIILEDDCLPDASFFPYCAELLERYRERPEVAYISGFNPLEREYTEAASYAFTSVVCMWGWATWRRTWQQYDEHMRGWPAAKADGVLARLFGDGRVVDYWSGIFDRMYEGTGPNTWDYQWVFMCWMRHMVAAFPGRNLIENIGWGADATHTTYVDPLLALPAGRMEFPLRHPAAVTDWPAYGMRMQKRFFAPSLTERIRQRAGRDMQRLRGRA